MNWSNLHHFLVLAREGSTNRAASVLGVHHTTVARRITALEEELGARLFDRHQSGYVLTRAAEDILEMVGEIELLTHTIERRVYGQDAALSGPLRLTVHYELANALIVPRLHLFFDRYPGIELEVLNSPGLVDLNTREADVAVRLTARPPENLIGRRIATIATGLYASPDYIASARPPYRTLIHLFEDGPPAWARDHFPDARVCMRSDSLSTLGKGAEDGLGIALLPCFYADRRAGLRRLPIELPASEWGVWILTNENLRTTARVRACTAFLEEILDAQREVITGASSRYESFG